MASKRAPLFFRAEGGTRTRDLRITNALLYQLSYFGLTVKPAAKLQKNRSVGEIKARYLFLYTLYHIFAYQY